MDPSDMTVLASSLARSSCTLSNSLPSSDNHQASKRNEKKSPHAVVLNGLSLPLVQISQQEGQQTPFQLTSGATSFAIENANLSVIFTPQPQTILQKTPTQTLTLNIVNTLPILSPNSAAGFTGSNPGKSKSIGKHICAHCGRDCLKPSVLEKHIRSHTGERPFPCNICGISFKTQSNLYKHRRTQTHVNNAKQSWDSDCGSCSEDRPHVQNEHNTCFDSNSGTSDVCIDKNPVQERENLPGNKEDVSRLSSLKIHEKTQEDCDYSSHTIVSPGVLNLQKATLDPKPTSRHGQLQRQHETCVDKQWDSSPSERKLKKCESTDSGYLSHSDSADLQIFSGSPLHSLSECSMESENMLGIGCGESEDKSSSSHKKNLEEHISMLISQNKAVVDNTHLDNVRPRKTALSKQGSIDLPMPYTFKDSFHFDINRKKVTLCSTKSTFTPPEKNKPLFFHSVPTQISTAIENIILTRSNSLPFVETGKLKDRLTVHNVKSHGLGKQPLNASYSNLLLSNTATACTVDFSCSHPRGLVRQAAVDEIHIGIGSDSTASGEIKEKKRATGDQLSSKLKTTSKKGGQKKLNMFSHEKWQMYGDETFKKFYQKVKKSEQAKKTKQDNPESKGSFNNEICLQAVCELEKSSENLTCIPIVPTPTSCISATTSLSKGMDAPISIGKQQIFLNQDSDGQKKETEAKPLSDLNMSKGDMNGSKNVPVNVPTSTSVYSNPGTVVTGNQQKAPNIPSIDDCSEVYYTDNGQSHERSPSHRKKPKVAQLKGKILYSVSLDITEDSIGRQNRNIDDITDSGKINVDNIANVDLSCGSPSTILKKDVLLSHEEGCRQIPPQSNKSQHFIPTTEPSLVLKETLFSPRYLIKCNFTGTSVEESVLQSNQPAVFGSVSTDTDLLNITEDVDSTCLLVPNKLCHPTFLESQPKWMQKHDSVIAPFGKISLNEEYVSICCSSKVSQHLVQNKSLDTQGSRYQNVRLDDTYPERHHALEECRVVEDLTSKQIDLKSYITLVSSGAMSTNEVNKPSQDPFLLDVIQPGQTCLKPLNGTGFPNQETPLFTAISSYAPSSICSIKVTQVSFSTLNTEPKSTWCWLDRCLPFPAEQKEKSYSVYASLSTEAIKERRTEPNGKTEKDVIHRATFVEQPVMSSLLMSAKQKDNVDEETDNGNYHPLVKRSSKTSTVMKSRHVKRSKDGTRGRSNSKMPQHRTPGALGQDQHHKKIIGSSRLESGELLLRTTNSELSDKEGSRTRIYHQTCQAGDLGQENEGKAPPESQINATTIFPASVSSEQLVTAEDNQSEFMENMVHPEPLQTASLLWKKSWSSIFSISNEGQHQHLRVCPPQKQVRKILHRSKTIGHSLGNDPVGSISGLPSSDSQSTFPVEAKNGIRRSSLQNIVSPDSHLAPNSANLGSTLGLGTLSLSCKPKPENHGEPSGIQNQSLKTQKKINLEVMRKQTHVEYSDSSSDDEDRLYIELLE
ncbi:zinc finger protein 831 [Dendropsophus ebraccatus]|uniref:zinc finger protein 831 n=1 Tax=Dendropsophus ebraccatus TaxID=150705 RepID=UPI0038314DF2